MDEIFPDLHLLPCGKVLRITPILDFQLDTVMCPGVVCGGMSEMCRKKKRLRPVSAQQRQATATTRAKKRLMSLCVGGTQQLLRAIHLSKNNTTKIT